VTTAATGGSAPAGTGGVLVVGYGNGLRSDDGVGPAVAARLAGDPRLAGADVRVMHQLTPELALDASRVSLLVLVDASADAPAGEVAVTRLDPEAVPGEAGEAMSHHVDPAGIVGLARELWGVAPPVVLVSVGIASLEAGERLTPAVEAAVPRAVDAVAAIIEEHGRA
jgi:hydrogenase maturation protease